jgi:hypothetical protein
MLPLTFNIAKTSNLVALLAKMSGFPHGRMTTSTYVLNADNRGHRVNVQRLLAVLVGATSPFRSFTDAHNVCRRPLIWPKDLLWNRISAVRAPRGLSRSKVDNVMSIEVFWWGFGVEERHDGQSNGNAKISLVLDDIFNEGNGMLL